VRERHGVYGWFRMASERVSGKSDVVTWVMVVSADVVRKAVATTTTVVAGATVNVVVNLIADISSVDDGAMP
jgi:hypothetical protein